VRQAPGRSAEPTDHFLEFARKGFRSMSRIILVLMLVFAAVAGCNLTRSDVRQDTILSRIGGGGQIIEPKRCALKVVTLSRPMGDEAVDAAVWRVADENVTPTELRQVLNANGLRVGLITGDLPPAVESVMTNKQQPHRVEPIDMMLPDRNPTMIKLSDPAPQVSLLLNLENRAFGKDYHDASGWFRVTPSQEGPTNVALRIAPEIHHGPIRRSFGAAPSTGEFAPLELRQVDGQQEDCLRELTVSLTLQPNQVAVIGCRKESKGSLGSFLFTQTEANSDRLLQKVLLIWASQNTYDPAKSGKPDFKNLRPIEPLEPAQSENSGEAKEPASALKP
jgi:hypothetical protein